MSVPPRMRAVVFEKPGVFTVVDAATPRSGQQAALGKDSLSPLPNIPGTSGSIDTVAIANVDRITQPDFYGPYYTGWKKAFGR